MISTNPTSISPAGAITGFYCDAISCHGFLRDRNGTFTTFVFPGAVDALATAINPAGAITGYYFDANGGHGFLRTDHGRGAR
jgi:hypothetical protein